MRLHMKDLQTEVKEARKTVHTLEAEVSYLTRYDRIEKFASEELGMTALNGSQIAQINEIDRIAPIVGVQETHALKPLSTPSITDQKTVAK